MVKKQMKYAFITGDILDII